MPRFLATTLLALIIVVSPSSMAHAQTTPHQPTKARIADHFTRAEIARADAYRGPATVIGLASLGLNLLTLGMLGLGRGSRRLGARIIKAKRWWASTLIAVAAITLIPTLVTVPLAIASWGHRRDFGLATDSLTASLRDVGISTLFQVAANAIVALAFVGVARRAPQRWPIITAAVASALTVGFVFAFPLLYEPAFNRFTPVDASTEGRIRALADREGVQVKDVLVSDASKRTTAQNAYVSGLGSSRRVVLYDTLLRGSPTKEVDLVVAHELAHVKHRDVAKGTLLAIVGVVVGIAIIWRMLASANLRRWIGADGASDPRVLPFLAFVLAAATLVTSPLASAVSRRAETAADRTALEVTSDPDTAVRLEVNLARSNLSDLTPNPVLRWFFATHPSTLERIQTALDFGTKAARP